MNGWAPSKSASRLSLACFFAVAMGAAAACGGSSTIASSSRLASPSANATASPTGSSKLDPAVPMPIGFPADLPIYPGARLTAGASFTTAGQPTTWGMEWETLDGVDKVQAFYSSKLSLGDWNIHVSGSANGSFSATFNRKSNPSSAAFSGPTGALA